jgi:uncharacterized protein (TIGR00730 family)
MSLKSVCVFCASSSRIKQIYLDNAFKCGELLAKEGFEIVYGGGGKGSMGAVANGALNNGAKVTGIIPKFMIDLEWAHPNVTNMIVVETMAERKSRMLEESDGVLVLPGGSGTLEELFETISLKRLGMYLKPIIILNTENYYEPLIRLLELSVKEKFMDERHIDMWRVINSPEEIVTALYSSVPWSSDAIGFAAV